MIESSVTVSYGSLVSGLLVYGKHSSKLSSVGDELDPIVHRASFLSVR